MYLGRNLIIYTGSKYTIKTLLRNLKQKDFTKFTFNFTKLKDTYVCGQEDSFLNVSYTPNSFVHLTVEFLTTLIKDV